MSATIQVRRGTASQWTSANPTLAAGEIGFETDTFKIKIGNGSTAWTSLQYAAGGNQFDTNIVFEGATADSYETTLQVTDPTADRTITLPDATGTVVLADGSGNVTVSGNLTVSGTTTTVNSTEITVQNALTFEGATADAYETTLTVVDPTADRTITFPNATGQVVLRDTTDTLTNKTINLTSNTLSTTLAQLNTAVSDADVASLAGAEVLTNKTISADDNTISGIAASSFVVSNASGNIDGAAAQKAIPTGTVVGTTDTQTLSGKTLSSAILTGTLTAGGGTGTSGQVLKSTGTGVEWGTAASAGAGLQDIFMMMGA